MRSSGIVRLDFGALGSSSVPRVFQAQLDLNSTINSPLNYTKHVASVGIAYCFTRSYKTI
jgi:hypothetical protein